jgi:hypothetical protein
VFSVSEEFSELSCLGLLGRRMLTENKESAGEEFVVIGTSGENFEKENVTFLSRESLCKMVV